MTFRDSDIAEAFWVFPCKSVQSGSDGHCSCNSVKVLMFLRKIRQNLSSTVGEAFPRRLQFSRKRIERADTVINIRMLFCETDSFALPRQNMNKDRFFHIPCEADHIFKLLQIMTVYRSEIIQSHGAKHVNRQKLVFHPLLQIVIKGIYGRYSGKHIAIQAFETEVSGTDPHALQKSCRAANIFIDRHVVVVENNDNRLFAGSGSRKAFIRQSARQGAVTQNRHNIIMLATEGSCLGHPNRNGNRVGGVAGNKSVIVTFMRLRETGDSSVLAQCIETFSASGYYFVDIALMTDIKNQTVT